MKRAMGILMVLMLVSTAWGFQTYQEAMDAGILKCQVPPKNFIGARTNFAEALTLATAMPETRFAEHLWNLSEPEIWIAHAYLAEENLVEAKKQYLKVLNMADSPYKQDAFEGLSKLVKTESEWQEIVSAINVSDWKSYFYRAKIKEQVKDWAGAKADLDTALALVPSEQAENVKLIAQELEKVKTQVQ